MIPHQLDGPDSHGVQLEPPIGTCYFKSYKYTISAGDVQFRANIDVTFYIYVTLAKPTDKDFTAKGGKVYIVAVYDGTAGGRLVQLLGTKIDFGLSGLASRINQLPIPGSGVQQGDTWLYTIDFAQTMNMYNNGGNAGFAFPARYKRTYSHKNYTQSEYQRMGWSLTPEGGFLGNRRPATNGLQIFETDKLEKVTCELFIGSSDPEQRYTKTFTLDFSAETMSKAVVG